MLSHIRKSMTSRRSLNVLSHYPFVRSVEKQIEQNGVSLSYFVNEEYDPSAQPFVDCRAFSPTECDARGISSVDSVISDNFKLMDNLHQSLSNELSNRSDV